MTTSEKCPVFICYRQSDGTSTAEYVYKILLNRHDYFNHENEEIPNFDIYFDITAPLVGDWQSVHEPYLKRARAFIVICSPGAKINEGKDDWVHFEIDWWLKNRTFPPIIIDPLGEGSRYIPKSILHKWPNAQRIELIKDQWDKTDEKRLKELKNRLLSQLIKSITGNNEAFYRQELDQEVRRRAKLKQALNTKDRLTQKLQKSIYMVIVLHIFSIVVVFYAFSARDEALSQEKIANQQRIIVVNQNKILKNQNVFLKLGIKLSNQFVRISRVMNALSLDCASTNNKTRSFKRIAQILADRISVFAKNGKKYSCDQLVNVKWDSLTWSGDPLRAALAHKQMHRDIQRFLATIRAIESIDTHLYTKMIYQKRIFDLPIISIHKIELMLEKLYLVSKTIDNMSIENLKKPSLRLKNNTSQHNDVVLQVFPEKNISQNEKIKRKKHHINSNLVNNKDRVELTEKENRSMLDGFKTSTKKTITVDPALKEFESNHRKFLMPIEDVFFIPGRGTVVTGRIERGEIGIDEEVEIVGIKKTTKTIVTDIEIPCKMQDRREEADKVCIFLKDTKRDEVERGQVLAFPDTINPHSHFEAQFHVFSKAKGGRHTPFFNGYRPQFYFRTTDITGKVSLPEGVEVVMPGAKLNLTVTLLIPIAMEEGLSFTIREGGRKVGDGLVTKILE